MTKRGHFLFALDQEKKSSKKKEGTFSALLLRGSN
jgi:hypothetical protein